MMKTQDAITALRPLATWAKGIAKLGEVLDMIQEKEKIVEQSEIRLTNLNNQIEDAESKWQLQKAAHEATAEEMKAKAARDLGVIEDNFNRRKIELDAALASEEATLREFKLSHKKVVDNSKDELAVLENSIRDKKNELGNLAETLKSALLNTHQFIGKVAEGQIVGQRVE